MEGLVKKDLNYYEFLNIGIVPSDFNITEKLLACPFDEVCHLPKHPFTCRTPECKECPDYKTRVRKLTSRVLF